MIATFAKTRKCIFVSATFAVDTAVLAVDNTIENTPNKLQEAVNLIATLANKWKIKLNKIK